MTTFLNTLFHCRRTVPMAALCTILTASPLFANTSFERRQIANTSLFSEDLSPKLHTPAPPLRKNNLETVKTRVDMLIEYQGQAQQVQAELLLAGRDSLSVSLDAFGLQLGKLFAKEEYFLFLDFFNGNAIEGKPEAEEIASVLRIPLSYNDFISILRCESPVSPVKYIKEGELEQDRAVYRFDTSDGIREFIVYSSVDSSITQIQRKYADGSLLMNVLYKDFTTIADIPVPQKTQISIPAEKFNLTVTMSNCIVNQPLASRLSFGIPKGFSIQKLH